MKVNKILIILALLATSAKAQNVESLINALVKVESNGKWNVVGDNGRAYGVLQIHSIMVREANRLGHTHYVHEDMFNVAKSRDVATIVLRDYAKQIKYKTGRTATLKELSFIWNGGGSAWTRVDSPINDTKQRNLENYWKKIAKNL